MHAQYFLTGLLFQIAHHHHHVPVPVPVPTYYNHHHHHHDEDYDGYEYPSHPHIKYRKDIEELKEWGIEPSYDDSYADPNHVIPASSSAYSGSYGLPQYTVKVKPLTSSYLDNTVSPNAHNLAYSGYVNDKLKAAKNPYAAYASNQRPVAPPSSPPHHHHHHQRMAAKSTSISRADNEETEDEFYGPIVDRLEHIFSQLRFHEETCREMLVCNMYKDPASYSPHSNIVSHELSR